MKSAEAYASDLESATKLQLFGTVPLLTQGAPTFIVCATIEPSGHEPEFKQRCIDYREHKDYDAWVLAGRPPFPAFPREYFEPDYPAVCPRDRARPENKLHSGRVQVRRKFVS